MTIPQSKAPGLLPGRDHRTQHPDTSEIVDIKKIKSSPSYPDVIPKQMVVKVEKRTIDGWMVDFPRKSQLPGVVIVEVSIDLENIRWVIISLISTVVLL